MSMRKCLSLVLACVIITLSPIKSFASASLLPDNQKLVSIDSTEGISEDEFKHVIRNFLSVYRPIVAKTGYKLAVKNRWTDETVNSNTYVDEERKTWVINAYGGLARSRGMTVDGYMMVMGHELGHHMGGAPTYPAPENWASNEGQSDYYAAAKAFRRVSDVGALLDPPNIEVPSLVELKCSIWQDQQNFNICLRSMMAAFALATVLNELEENPVPVAFETPDRRMVKRTFDGHPAAQSRLDTMVAGAICQVDYHIEFSRKDPSIGACMSGPGARPRSWYAPSSSVRTFIEMPLAFTSTLRSFFLNRYSI